MGDETDPALPVPLLLIRSLLVVPTFAVFVRLNWAYEQGPHNQDSSGAANRAQPARYALNRTVTCRAQPAR